MNGVLSCKGTRMPSEILSFIANILGGVHGRIAVTYMQWSGDRDQLVRIPWRMIDSFQSSSQFADEIGRLPVILEFGDTSIGSALSFSAEMFKQSPFEATRRVIDISGDGNSNEGQPVEKVRDKIVSRGITINGLAMIFTIPTGDPNFVSRGFLLHSQNDLLLGSYYKDHVIGGPDSFVSTIHDQSDFAQALKMKLVREIAGRTVNCAQTHWRNILPGRASCS
jgi:hypothetical protein